MEKNTDKTTTNELIKVAVSGWMGTLLEYIDFQLYGLAAALIFNTIFFPKFSPAAGLMASMATYGVGYFARIYGAYVFGRLGDRIGRKDVLVMTIVLMGGGSTLIGFLPTYSQIGLWAPFMLLILRLVQGFGAGAEISGAAIMLTEYAPPKKRGLLASFVALGTNLGTLFASAIWLILLGVLNHDQFISWGWRIPFLCSFLIMLFGIWIRTHIKETPVFLAHTDVVNGTAIATKELKEIAESKRKIKESAVVEKTLKKRKNKSFFLALGLRFGQNGNSSLVQTFLIGYLTTTMFVNKSIPTLALVYGSLLAIPVVILVGVLGDHFGRRTMYLVLTVISSIAAWPLILMTMSGTKWMVILGIMLLLNLCVVDLFSLENATMCELFGVRNRYTQLALSKEIGGSLSAGIAPFAAASFCALAGSYWPVVVMIIAFSFIALVSALACPEVTGRDLNDINDAADYKEAEKPIAF